MKLELRWEEIEKLFIALQNPKSMNELKDLYGWRNVSKFKAKYVTPLIEKQFVGMLLPDKPTSPKQKYYLTDLGKSLLTNETKERFSLQNTSKKIYQLIANMSDVEKRIALKILSLELN